MLVTKLKSKIHHAVVSYTDVDYEGSCLVCPDLMEAANIEEYEQIQIYNVTNGQRFTTYAIAGSHGTFAVLGAAARLTQPGDTVIICTYGIMTANEQYKPTVVYVNKHNEILDERNATFL